MNAPLRAPFPYAGGKRRAAAMVWSALGNVDHYVEPFCGSAAVLLARPEAGRCETVNDKDSMVANFWRAVKSSPEAVAHHLDWPVVETDLHARHRWLIGQREDLTERLIADPDWHDPKIAGWWCWGACAWIGHGWCGGESRRIPALGSEGRGIAALSRQLPHLSTGGMGVHAARRGPGVADDAVGFTSPREWLQALGARLRNVRVASGDWQRVATPAVRMPTSMPSRAVCGVYLDPPYSEGDQQYAVGGTGTSLSAEVRAWCVALGGDPRLRIVLSGYDTEHAELEALGWRVEAWKTKGGYSSQGGENANQKRERLWCSPHCVGVKQPSLFGGGRP